MGLPDPMGADHAACTSFAPVYSPSAPIAPAQPLHRFDGGAAGWLGVQLAGFFVTVLTLGICYPCTVVMTYRWKASHTLLQGRRLHFTGTAVGLFGQSITRLVLIVVTVGIYGCWVYPRLLSWATEHQAFAD